MRECRDCGSLDRVEGVPGDPGSDWLCAACRLDLTIDDLTDPLASDILSEWGVRLVRGLDPAFWVGEILSQARRQPAEWALCWSWDHDAWIPVPYGGLDQIEDALPGHYWMGAES